MEPDHDDKLVARYLAGEVEAFDELLRRYKDGLFSYLYSMVRSREEAEDLLQETFLRVIAALPRYRARGKFRAWIFKIARNLVQDRARKLMVTGVPVRLETSEPDTTEAPYAVISQADDKPSPREVAMAQEKRDWIERAIQKLPQAQKEVFTLRAYAGMPFKEIAVVQRSPLGTVLARMHYALKKLRAELQKERESY